MSTKRSSPDPTVPAQNLAPVVGVKESLVTIDVSDTAVMKNEVGYVLVGQERLKAEVLRVQGDVADMQVFEETQGVKVGDEVELSGEMLSATLGPGLLGQVYDGLQVPLDVVASSHGFFLPRGASVPAVNLEREWKFEPRQVPGVRLVAGETIGVTQEGPFEHRIMVPFEEAGPVELTWVREGPAKVNDTVARIKRSDGSERDVTLVQTWPVRRPLPENMLTRRFAERLYPDEPITTTQRIIDTFLPLARGGTGCIPGPFGAGKTVLQSCIARYSTVDIVIIIACGERAGEVVETITDYPKLTDPRTGGTLMDRAIIIANTSSMPVAAREASIFTGITLGEYYRQMGYNVLCIADSTSRWAQAMRETSGRMEEIPGEEAFPAYLDSSVKNIYERAGVIKTPDGDTGSLTIVGTVSPAGGNFEEPVTQATLGTVKCFLGLSSDRAYKRFYPAIDPLISWSRYLGQLRPWFSKHLGPEWVETVERYQELLVEGDSIYQMMQVTGEEGITLDDFIRYQKSVLLDMCYLQQDAFDKVDASMPRERQKRSFELLSWLIDAAYDFPNKDAIREFFTRVTGLYRNLNYAADGSPEYDRYETQIRELAHTVHVERDA